MIKCSAGETSWKGHKIIIRTELTTLIHSLIEKEVFTPEEIDDIVADAKKTKEQIAEEIETLEKEVTPEQRAFVNMMAELFTVVGDRDLNEFLN